jgi:hypothetical protein
VLVEVEWDREGPRLRLGAREGEVVKLLKLPGGVPR